MTATISGNAPTSDQKTDLQDSFELANQIAHDSTGTGSARCIVHKSDINYMDSTIQAGVIGGGGTQTGSARTLEVGTDSRNEIGAHASYTPGAADVSVIAGGYDHRNDQLAGTISGGGHNLLNYQGSHGVIAGGSQNAVVNATDYAVIGGGTQNQIGVTADADHATIGGGFNNDITQGANNTVSGGINNAITSSDTQGGNTIGGGSSNTISGSIDTSTIGGGYGNTITGSGQYEAIVGGNSNTINSTGNGAAIIGGTANTNNGAYTLMSGSSNTAGSNCTASLVAGASCTVSDAYQFAFGNSVSPPSGAEGSITFGANGAAFGSVGSAQAISLVYTAQTTDAATDTIMYLRSTKAPQLPANSAWTGRVLVIGKEAATADVSAYEFKFCVSRASGNIVVEYEPAAASKYLNGSNAPDDNGVGATNVPRIRTGTSNFQLLVNGAASTTIDWVARVDVVQVIAA